MIDAPIPIQPDELSLAFVRSSGPGGQNVNKVSTAVELRFDARRCRSLDPGARERLLGLAGRRVNASGEILIEARRFRTQARNRQDALERLFGRIEKALRAPRVRQRTRPTTGSQVRRLEAKKRRSATKKMRARASEGEG